MKNEKKRGTLQIRAYDRNMDLVVLKPSLGSTAKMSRLGGMFAARDGDLMEEREEQNTNGMHIQVLGDTKAAERLSVLPYLLGG